MDKQRRAEIEVLLSQARRLERGGRSEFLAGIADDCIRVEVETRLNADAAATSPFGAEFQALFGKDALSGETVPLAAAVPHDTIGPYRLIQIVGKGGMGEVWLAEQTSPVRRRVALKLIKPGMDTSEVLRRFQSEFQALALMDHPGIAKVFEAGSTPQGRPYFAMEYVAGLPITDYCDEHRLGIEERLRVFCRVCEAVQHAHQKAIIHRDLKPSNVLVTEVDASAMPKIIDFGVAKALSQRLAPETMFTRVGAVVGTPGYMSPEQALSSREDIDTRADVYSLGVVLYELLAGALPLDYSNLQFDDMVRSLREKEPPPPSTKLLTLGKEAGPIARNRQTEAGALRRELRGDLDLIALKALEKNRTTRYGSASELAADVGRYLANEPILARPASFVYGAKKAIVRNKLAFASATALIAILAAFSLTEAFQLRRITEERNRSERTVGFIIDMFRVPHHGMGPGLGITAEEILRTADNEVQSNYARYPVMKGRLENALGEIYFNLGGSNDRAEMLARDAVRTLTKADGPGGRETLRAKRVLGIVLASSDKAETRSEAEQILRETVNADRHVMGSADPETLKCIAILGEIAYDSEIRNKKKDFSESEALLREAADGQSRVLGADNPTALKAKLMLAGVLNYDHKYPQAESVAREVVDAGRQGIPGDHAIFEHGL